MRLTNPEASGFIVDEAVSNWVSLLPSCPPLLALNSKPRKWLIPQGLIKTQAFKNVGSTENRSGKEEVGEVVYVGTGHRSWPGLTWWAFLCVQRTDMHNDSCFAHTSPLFSWLSQLIEVISDDVAGANGSPTDGLHSPGEYPSLLPNMDTKASH